MTVNVAGSVLSALFYEHCNSANNQEGLLLGRAVNHVTDTISDSQINHRKEETVIYIYSFLPCFGDINWYDGGGGLIPEGINNILAGRNKDVIGWYRLRRNSSLALSLREKNLHKSLTRYLSPSKPVNFLFLLCAPTTAHNVATHTIDHTFFVRNDRSFQSVPVSVTNLGDTAQSDYKLEPSNAVHPKTGVYGQLVNQFQSDFLTESGDLQSVQCVTSLNCRLQQQLTTLCQQATASEAEVGQLESQVAKLNDQLLTLQPPKRPPPRPPKGKELLDKYASDASGNASGARKQKVTLPTTIPADATTLPPTSLPASPPPTSPSLMSTSPPMTYQTPDLPTATRRRYLEKRSMDRTDSYAHAMDDILMDDLISLDEGREASDHPRGHPRGHPCGTPPPPDAPRPTQSASNPFIPAANLNVSPFELDSSDDGPMFVATSVAAADYPSDILSTPTPVSELAASDDVPVAGKWTSRDAVVLEGVARQGAPLGGVATGGQHGDAFSFVADLLEKAKSPTSESSECMARAEGDADQPARGRGVTPREPRPNGIPGQWSGQGGAQVRGVTTSGKVLSTASDDPYDEEMTQDESRDSSGSPEF